MQRIGQNFSLRVTAVLLIIFSACNKQPTGKGETFDNQPPETAFAPTPPEGSMNNAFKLRVEWHANDADGIIKKYEYRVDGPLYDNAWISTASFFVDFKFRNGWYTIEVRAEDNAGNVDPTPAKRRFHVQGPTFDEGILLLDDDHLSGTNKTVADAIYDSVMHFAGYSRYSKWDYEALFLQRNLRPLFTAAASDTEATGKRKPSLGSFSTIIWYTHPEGNIHLNKNTLQDYLDMGGNLIIAGFNPLEALTGDSARGEEFPASSLAYKYFRLQRASTVKIYADQILSARPNLPDIRTALRRQTGFIHYLYGETNQLVPFDAEPLFVYSRNFYHDAGRNLDINSEEFAGLPCAVWHRGQNFNTAIFGFPLVYLTLVSFKQINLLDTRAAGQAVGYLLREIFEERQ